MNNIIGLGNYLLALPVPVFGIFHFINADAMAGMAPFGGALMVYFTGICLLAAAVSILIGKMDKIASTLLGIMLLLFIIPHAQNMANDQMKLGNILKNIAMAGGAFLYASSVKDDAYVK
jgi:putative oxidoreductase